MVSLQDGESPCPYSCRLFLNKNFKYKDGYLAHIRKMHPEMLEHEDKHIVVGIAQPPMEQLPAERTAPTVGTGCTV